MEDIIQLLPDHIANQIAAGEVIQRPASVVKELMENAIDAGATHIHLIIKEAGKEAIQVIDNGKGMSPSDARMCFEKHATSKIKSIDDLFSIHTMGFRGEALASIAAVAQVEMRTCTHDAEVGTHITIENSSVVTQEPCQAIKGTNISVKNLFFNIPARKNFLKTNSAEFRHILDEFIRIAMAHPHIAFQLTNNQTLVYNVINGKLHQRIVALLGNNYESKLVPVSEETDIVKIHGYIATPDMASKRKGNQYFFVNNRFIKSPYLNHAVSSAFKDLIPKDEFPSFFLFIDLDPARIDINVHPTKQEIKFDDDKIVYSFVSAAVKHALGKYAITPTLDFSLHAPTENLDALRLPFTEQKKEQTKQDFIFQSFTEKGKAHFLDKKEDIRNWKELYKIQNEFQLQSELLDANTQKENSNVLPFEDSFKEELIQVSNSFILATTRHGCLFIDQHQAHIRILYDRYVQYMQAPMVVQPLAIPVSFELSAADTALMQEIVPTLHSFGYHVEHFGGDTFVIQALPTHITQGGEIEALVSLLDDIKQDINESSAIQKEKIILNLAKMDAIKHGEQLKHENIQQLFTELFQCEQPTLSPTGKKIFVKLNFQDIEKLFFR